jgi:CheY-like chemotaxis protein
MQTLLRDLSILIVEDEPETRAMLSAYFEKCGATAWAAASVADAVAIAARVALDVIVTDLAMPDEDGYSLLDRIRALEGCATIPMISLSGFASLDEFRKSAAAGFQLHVVKPVRPGVLAASIQEIVAHTAR